MTELQTTEKLENALAAAESVVNKSYIEYLENLKPVKPDYSTVDIDVAVCGSFYRLSRLVLDREENFINRLITVAHTAASLDASLCTILRSSGSSVDYYIGIISKNMRDTTDYGTKLRAAAAEAFAGTIRGNFAGSELDRINADEIKRLKDDMFRECNAVSAVSGITSLRDAESGTAGYVQGIENLVNAMAGRKYTIMLVADPVSPSGIRHIQSGYEKIYSELSVFEKQNITMNRTEGITLSDSQTESITKGITEGVSNTRTTGGFSSQSRGKSIGGSVGIKVGINKIFGINGGVNFDKSKTKTTGDNWSNAYGTNSSEMFQKSRGTTTTSGTNESESRSLALEMKNRSVTSILERIEENLKRLDECASYGAFECAAYVLSDCRETAVTVAGSYAALMRGEESKNQFSRINTWDEYSDGMEYIRRYLTAFTHPLFYGDDYRSYKVNPAALMSGTELSAQLGFPVKSVNGIAVTEMTPFGRNFPESRGRSLEIGNMYYMGHEDRLRVSLDLDSLTSHMFVTGSTGSGKSNAVYNILHKAMAQGVKFMVIEPAKGEYKNVFGAMKNVSVYGTNDAYTPLLVINPFSFPARTHVIEHIERLTDIFNVCWPMYAAMPAVLKRAIERAYEVCGWDLDTSGNSVGNIFPCFDDLLRELRNVIRESEYSQEVKDNYSGSLITRVSSLTNGIYRRIFTANEIPYDRLFSENVIVDLSRIGLSETKSLVMGLLVMKMNEFRMENGGGNLGLRHLTVIEEAHNLLKDAPAGSGESGNLAAKSVEMIANAISEMRTYGEGFIIADQAPGLLDRSVIRNTNTKMILRLPDYMDCELAGRACSMNDARIAELSRLETGVAAVYQSRWDEPVLCKTDLCSLKYSEYKYIKPIKDTENSFIPDLMKYTFSAMTGEKAAADKKELQQRLLKSDISGGAKAQFIGWFRSGPPVSIRQAYRAVADCFDIDKIMRSVSRADVDSFNDELVRCCGISQLSEKLRLRIIECILHAHEKMRGAFKGETRQWCEAMKKKGVLK